MTFNLLLAAGTILNRCVDQDAIHACESLCMGPFNRLRREVAEKEEDCEGSTQGEPRGLSADRVTG